MDIELYKLCKEVYERTNLHDIDQYINQDGQIVYSPKWYDDNIVEDLNIAPAYTSDYLFNKLVEQKYQLRLEHNHADMRWYAYYAGKTPHRLFEADNDWVTGADTPLKSLLNLVLSLDDTGELK